MKFTFSKVARHRVFQHDPIYYDEKKEESQERERRIKSELGLLDNAEKESGYSGRIKGGMRRRVSSNFDVARSEKKRSNLRLIIILIALFALGLYLVESGMEWLNAYLGE